MDINDPAIQNIITATAAAAVAQYVRDHPPLLGPAGPLGDRGLAGNDGVGGVGNGALKADDVGFFDPFYEDSSNSNTTVVNAGRHVFYRDVYAFIDRLKDLINLKEEDKVREVLPTYFRGSAQIWHSTELTELKKRGLRNTSVSNWGDTLVEQFKERTSVALRHLQAEHYTINNARQGRTPRSFMQNMLRHTKAAHIDSIYNQLTLAWNNLAVELRRDIPEPTLTTTLSQFLRQLDSKENLWYEIARQQGRSQPQQHIDRRSSSTLQKQSGQYNNRQGGFSKPPFPSQPYNQQTQGFSQMYGNYYRNSYANQSPRQYQPYPQNPPRQPNPGPILPVPRQPLQITGGSGSTSQSSNQPNPRSGGSSGRPTNRPNAGYFNRNQRPLRQQGTAYQASETDSPIPTPTEFDSESIPEDSLTSQAEEPGNYYADEEIDYYQPRQEDKAEGYFAGPTGISHVATHQCRRCHKVFSSKNEMHKHLSSAGKGRRILKSSCLGRPLPVDLPSVTTSAEAFPAAINDSQEAEIIESTVDSTQEIGSGLTFRGYHYAMEATKLTPKAEDEDLCFDTGCSITLIDRSWLHKTLPSAKIHQMASAITIRGLKSNKHPTSEYTIFPLLFPGKRKDGKQVTAKTASREVHIIDNLKAKMLVGMDVMVPEKIDIFASTSTAWIGSYQVEIPLEIRTRGRPVTHPIHAKQSTIIPPHSQA